MRLIYRAASRPPLHRRSCPRALEPQRTPGHCSSCCNLLLHLPMWTDARARRSRAASRPVCNPAAEPNACMLQEMTQFSSSPSSSQCRSRGIALPSSDTNEEASGILFPSRSSGNQAESRLGFPTVLVGQGNGWGRGKRPSLLPTTPRAPGLVGLISRLPSILADAKTGPRWCSQGGKSTSRASICCSCTYDQIASHIQHQIQRRQRQADSHRSRWNMKDTQDCNGCKHDSRKLGMGR